MIRKWDTPKPGETIDEYALRHNALEGAPGYQPSTQEEMDSSYVEGDDDVGVILTVGQQKPE